VQVPDASIETSKLDTVQTSCVVDVSVTVRFESEVAVTVKGVVENSLSLGSAYVIV
jgi:hypothetical protein